MGFLVFKNFASTPLAFDLNVGDLTALVVNGDVFPDAPTEGEFVAVLEDVDANKEIVRCTARSGDTLTITRAQEGTIERNFAAGTQIELRPTAGSMDEYFTNAGYDGRDWTTTSGATRKAVQLRRNPSNPADLPDDLYEGELAVNLSTTVPSLYVGPVGAANDGAGVLVVPFKASATEPANPFEGLYWLHDTTFELKVYQNGAFRGIKVSDIIGSSAYATIVYVDEQIDTVMSNLYAPAQTRLFCMQHAAPPGWVQDTTVHDRVVRLTNGNGGAGGGNWSIQGLTAHGHALTLAEMPAHNHGGGDHAHTYSVSASNRGNEFGPEANLNYLANAATGNSGVVIATQGGGAQHSHLVSGDGTWRPAYMDAIVVIKS